MTIRENFSLKNHNTFRVDVKARYFIEVFSEEEIRDFIKDPKFKKFSIFIIGDGSNILFTKDFNGIIIKAFVLGRRIIKETDKYILLEIGSGENWQKTVNYAVNNNWGGIENLALIPGTVGAAAVQNIAAYGQNFSDIFYSLDAINLETGAIENFDKKMCEFGYRESIFKNRLKGKYIIIRSVLKLLKHPQIETSYYQIGINHNSIKNELTKIAIEPWSIKDIYNAVINIRKRKLPDSLIVPNVGSVFLNPLVSSKKLLELKNKVPELQYYPAEHLLYKEDLIKKSLNNTDFMKIAAGRLFQELGWLGKWIGNCGVHNNHALIVVTNSKASGEEILKFINLMKQDFYENYKIELATEVNIV